jgi:WD40 repeat protein/transcriptional regulator with XRE-family HTH domain
VTRRSYRDRDYAFGEAILTLRDKLGLTQAGLANILGVSRRAVVGWEAGNSYPKTEYFKELLAVAIKRHAFPAGKEADKIREFWQIAHQKVLLDEDWLTELVPSTETLQVEATGESTARTLLPTPGSAHEGPQVDWSDALAVPAFYGREWELNLLIGWILEERCRVVSIVGLGGIGKSALSVNVMHQVASNFEVVIWRSLRDAPPCGVLFEDLLRALVPQAREELNANGERQQKILLKVLRSNRVLLVLDNLETILEEGALEGHILAGYEAFRQFLRQLAETEHQSCVVLTTREKLIDLVPAEGNGAPVRTLRLARLNADACKKLLTERQVRGSVENQMHLIDAYAGNPLALKIVAQTIADLFGGEIAAFLDQGDIIFGDVRALLDEQFARLSPLEQNVLVWLAIMREPFNLDELLTVMVKPVSRVDLLEAILSLHRRSLIELGQLKGSFTLQSVVLEYGTSRLISALRAEIETGKLVRLLEHGLVLAYAREYVRQTQERLVAAPILALLQNSYFDQTEVEQHLLALLAQFRSRPGNSQGYGPGNLVTLLRLLRGDLRALDLSHLLLRGAYFQSIEMQDTSLAHATIQDSVFSESFDRMVSLSISGSGEYWATGGVNGEVRIYQAGGRILYRRWQTHTDARVALSPDGRLLACGNGRGEIHVWDVASGALLWLAQHSMGLGHFNQLAFSPDGRFLAAASDTGLSLWDAAHNTLLTALPHPQPVPCIAWRGDSAVLASGDAVGTIRYWAIHPDASADLLMAVQGHGNVITALAFSEADDRLASGSWDGTVRLWDATDGSLQETLVSHPEKVPHLTWSADGRVIAYNVHNEASWLWDVKEGRHRAALRGHTAFVRGLLFTPDSREIVSASMDGTIRVWDTATGACIRIIYGYASSVEEMSWSPDGTRLVSIEPGLSPIVYSLNETMPSMVLRGHTDDALFAKWSPDGRLISIGSFDAIRLWDANTGEAQENLSYPDDPGNSFRNCAWSPDGRRLAAATVTHGIQLFELATGAVQSLGSAQRAGANSYNLIQWSPNGSMLAADFEDGMIGVWNTESGERLLRVPGERWCLAWSADSSRLAVIESRNDGSELVLWDVGQRERKHLALHTGEVFGMEWMRRDNLLITYGDDGWLRWWDLQTGDCVRQVQAHSGKRINEPHLSPDETLIASIGDEGGILIWDAHTGDWLKTLRRDRPYERMNITGIRGLNDAQKATLHALGAIEKTQSRKITSESNSSFE